MSQMTTDLIGLSGHNKQGFLLLFCGVMCGNFQLVPPTALIAQNKSQVSTFEGHVPMM